MKNWNLSYLKYFYDAASQKSMVLSAKKNFVTQSAVSQAIKRLGELMGAPLVHHQKRLFHLTDEGRFLFQRCKNIFEAVESLESEFSDNLATLQGEIVIATSQTLAVCCIANTLALYRQLYPRSTPKLLLGKSLLVKQWVQDGIADIGVLVEKGKADGLNSTTIASGEFIVIEPLKKQAKSSNEFLVTEERNEVAAFKRLYERRFKSPMEVMMVVESWNVISSLVQAGLGRGLVPDFVAKGNPKLRTVDLKLPKQRYDIVAVTKTGYSPSRKTRAFLDLLKPPT